MLTEKPEAYNGPLPYIFVSYSSIDAKKVLPIIGFLQQDGYRIWYDEGIEAGSEWSDRIAEKVNKCTAFLFFVSENSVSSENCLDEIAHAKKMKKPVLMVHLKKAVSLPDGMDMQTSRYQQLFYYKYLSYESFIKDFSEAQAFSLCKGIHTVTLWGKIKRKLRIKKTFSSGKPMSKKKIFLMLIALFVFWVVTCEYVPPLNLGTDITSGIIAVEEELYRLPTPVKNFTDKGWVITKSPEIIASGETKYIYMKKGAAELQCEVMNKDDAGAAAQECQLVSVTVYSHNSTFFELPGGLSSVQTEQVAVQKIMTSVTADNLKVEHNDGETLYCYSYPEDDFTLRVCIDNEKGTVKSLYIKRGKTIIE